MTKKEWKYFYRRLRVCRRESRKATHDVLIYGTGFLYNCNGDCKHIPLDSIVRIE